MKNIAWLLVVLLLANGIYWFRLAEKRDVNIRMDIRMSDGSYFNVCSDKIDNYIKNSSRNNFRCEYVRNDKIVLALLQVYK